MAKPHYITTSLGQVRLWWAGSGPSLVALAGLTGSASFLAAELTGAFPQRRVLVLEPPGIGGSADAGSDSPAAAGAAVIEALAFLGDEEFDLVACEMSAALVPTVLAGLPHQPSRTVLVGFDRAMAWARTHTSPPDLSSRNDGTHLNALWTFLRDRRLLRPDDPTLPSASGPDLPGEAELSDAFVAAAVSPGQFATMWDMCARELSSVSGLTGVQYVETTGALAASLDARGPGGGHASELPSTRPAAGTRIWHQYVDTELGRAHLRRAGSQGRPVLVLPTGGGSSAQFAPVISGLAESRMVFAVDYFGNGLSDKTVRDVTIETLVREAVAVLDALGLDEVDVWGSHTGACAALELAISFPERVGKVVMEAPVMVTPEFRDELLENYFPDFTPDKFGLHIQHLWHWRRDMFMYWPWYSVDWGSTRQLGVPRAEELHKYAVGILESGTTYSGAYRAGFSYDTWSRLPLLHRQAILTAGPYDMLANAVQDAARIAPEGMLEIHKTPTTMWWPDPEPAAAAETLALYRAFLE